MNEYHLLILPKLTFHVLDVFFIQGMDGRLTLQKHSMRGRACERLQLHKRSPDPNEYSARGDIGSWPWFCMLHGNAAAG